MAPPRAASLGAATAEALDAVIARAATRGERIVCLARGTLAAVSLVRSFCVWADIGLVPISPRVIVGTSLVSALLLLSVWIRVAYRERAAPCWVLAISVTADGVACLGALLANVLWPTPGYHGFLHQPDTAGSLVVVVATGLRLSPILAAYGGLLAAAGLVALVAIDSSVLQQTTGGEAKDLSAQLFLVVTLAIGAMIMAVGARRLVRESALRALRIEETERTLGALLHEQHDLRTMLSSASLNTDLVLRCLAGGGTPQDASALAERAREDLLGVCGLVARVRARSYEELMALQAPAPVDVEAVFSRVARPVRSRFPEVVIRVRASGSPTARVAGGESSLARAALNLLVNACEGNGSQGASTIHVRIRCEGPDLLRVEVEDDGPGFDALVLEAPGGGYTTKPDGGGLGLTYIEAMMRASGGAWICENRKEGGARVVLELSSAIPDD